MRLALILGILLMLVIGCKAPEVEQPITTTISGVQELVLTNQDLEQLGLVSDGVNCTTEEYETGEFSSLAQYGFCQFNISGTKDTEVVIELKKFTNLHDLNGSYQYESSHLFGSKGILSLNELGDQSKFHVNNEDDYGAEFNEPGVYFYHLWFTKDIYLIHVTSKGYENAEVQIESIGREILSKFG